ncbi:hypothetical protein EDD18DRAFT_1115660 [Armillaria luteobubalina]|uniref:CxC2-like cysteine cluster KDZ transposase-associated domain-containing protein n=1 Tax=Armillaria luteobubalina TaxID=153913 RepID=A0AA39U7B2_9AGAR|nr:hypothetical protein EDD18DRAFT_1115660 [Armillaria luteobubalina]
MSRRQHCTIERYRCLPNGKVERVSAKQPIQTPARQATLSGTMTRRLQHVEISTLADDLIVHQRKQHDIDVERNYGSQTKKIALDGGQRLEGKLSYQPNPVFPPDFDFAEAANLTDQLLQQVRPRHKKRTIDDEPLHRWIQEIDSYLVELLRLEAQTGSEICRGFNEHQDALFHRIEEWNSTFYSQITLQDVGLKVQLGHLSGKTCPYPQASGRSVIVIDVEGIHKINMLRAQWFPATVEFPRTAMTFAVLRHFQMMSFMSKVSGYEYYQSLARLHDNTGSLMLPGIIRKKTFGSTTRLWKKRAHVMITTQLSSLRCMGVKGCLQVRMDLPTLLTLKTEAPKEVVIAYDIGCQWGKNLWKRINVYGPDLTPPQKQKDIVILVPKFHLPAHIVECQEEFSFAFELFIGETDGEATEQTWAILNPVASSMREMGLGSRQDTLDDHWSDHNWQKNARNGQSGWNHGSDTVQVEKKSKIPTFQQSNFDQSNDFGHDIALTMASVCLQLSEEGLDAQWGASMGTLISVNKMIADGLLAKQAQLDLQKEMKALGPHSTDIQHVKATEALGIVRWKVILETYVVNHKGVYGHSQKIGTASNNLLDVCHVEKTWSMATYNRAHEALWHLAGPLGMTDWYKTYRVLWIKDTVPIAGLKQRKKRDTSSKEMSGESTAPQLSWIWLIAGAVNNSTPEGLQDEMQRVLRSHEYNIKLWSNRAERSIKGAAHAFVRQQMKAYCEQTWSSVEEWLKIGQIHENEGDVDDADLLGEESESHVTAILGSKRN